VAGSPATQRSWEEKRPPRRWSGPAPHRGRKPPTGFAWGASALLAGPTWVGGSRRSFGVAEVLWVACPVSSGAGCVFELSGSGGSRIRGVVGEHSRGEETQESIGRWRGATRVSRERIRKRRNASKQVKLAVGSEFVVRAQFVREAGLRVGEKGGHSRPGTPGKRVKARESAETVR